MLPPGLSAAFVLAFLGALAARVSAAVRPVCVEEYRISPGDSCATITAWSGLTAAEIQALNPGVDCSQSLAPLVDHYFCLGSYVPACTHEVTALSNDTCSSLGAAWQISEGDFELLNDNLDDACDNLVVGEQYCVSDIDCYFGNDEYCCTPEGEPNC